MARLELKENERIDWFRVIVDIERQGVTTYKIASNLDFAQSTLMGWKLERHRPKFEDGLKLLNCWCKITKKHLEQAPRHNPARPDLRFKKVIN